MEMESENMSKESFASSLILLHESRGGELWELWKEMGCGPEVISKRWKRVLDCIAENYDAMIFEEKSHRADLVKSIEENYRKLRSLRKELNLETLDDDPSENLSLIELEKALRDSTEELLRHKTKIMEDVNKYRREDEALAKSLGLDSYSLPFNVVPSSEQFQSLKEHVKYFSELKSERFASFVEKKLAIIDYMNKLEIEPATSFERAIVCETDEAFSPLSTDRLQYVEKILDSLVVSLEKNEQEALSLKNQIRDISAKLNLDSRELNDFLTKYSGSSPRTLKDLQFKLDELLVLKDQHMEKFIAASRKELEEWWDKCFYGHAQRAQFHSYFSTNFTEELLQEHEEEIENIKSYYLKNKDLFTLVQRRQCLWDTKIELENKAKDPNRYKAKSTNLLKESRDRNRVEKQLPKIEESLEEAMLAYETKHGIQFKVGGIPYRVYIEQQIKGHEEMLEKEKKQKADERKKLIVQETIFGSTPVKLNATKRKACNNLPSSTLKRAKPSITTVTSSSDNTRSVTSVSRMSTRSRSSLRTKYSDNSNTLSSNAHNSIISGPNFSKFTPSMTSLSSINTEFDPFYRSHLNIINSTLQPTSATPVKRKGSPKTRHNVVGKYKTRRSKSTVQIRITKVSPSRNSTPKNVFKTPTNKRVLTPANKTHKLSSLRSGKKLPFAI